MKPNHNNVAYQLWIHFLRQLKNIGQYSHIHKELGRSMPQITDLRTLRGVLSQLYILGNREISNLIETTDHIICTLQLKYQEEAVIQFLESNSPIKTRFINNLNNLRGRDINEYVKTISRKGFSLFFSSAFSWADSPEGFEFWSDIANKYRNLEKFY